MLLPRRHPAPDEVAAARLAALRPLPRQAPPTSAPSRPSRQAPPSSAPSLDERLGLGEGLADVTGPTAPAEPVGWVPPAPEPSWVAPPAPPGPVDSADLVGPNEPPAASGSRTGSPLLADLATAPAPSAPPSAPPSAESEPGRPTRSWSYTSEAGGTLEQDTSEPEPTLWDRLRGGRFDPGRGGAAALALVALVAVAVTAFVFLRGRPQAVEASSVVASGRPVASAPGASETPAPGAVVVVAVSGAVRRPGVVRLPAGSRVDDAIRAAGGALRQKDLALVNLARKVTDGEQVLVGAAASPATGGAGSSAAAGPLDLNQATAEQLDALPGIGPVLAQKIVDYRSQHGSFASVDQLREVSGIGESRFADLKSLVRV